MTDSEHGFDVGPCPHCHADIRGDWINVDVSWSRDGVVDASADCPKCGKDMTEPPRIVDYQNTDMDGLQFMSGIPSGISGDVTFETLDTMHEQFDATPPFWETAGGAVGDERLPPTDTATWQIRALRENVSVMAEGKLPLATVIDGIPVTVDQHGDGPIQVTLNEDSTFTITSPDQVPLTLFETIEIRRLDS